MVMRGEENEEENEMAKRRKRNDDDDLQITCAPEEEEEEEEEELLKRGRPLAWGVAKTRTPFREVHFEEGRQYECRIPSLLAAFEQIEQKLKKKKPISTDPKTFDPDTILKIDEDCSEKAISLGYKLGTIKHSAYALLAMAGPGGMKAANIVSIAKRLDLKPLWSETEVVQRGRRGVDSFGREIWHSLVVSFEFRRRKRKGEDQLDDREVGIIVPKMTSERH
jgi:hypothetical protein